ncbi:hypothetical protein BC833DRAFT_653001 [Globomyces pollinis-pini]|nr:hypothetical protein BC833DRAFT_653001 [Globomyces pollinis-pini]
MANDDQSQNIGFNHWIQQRNNIIATHTHPYEPLDNTSIKHKKNPLLQDVELYHLDDIYDALMSGRKFIQKVPLSFVTTVLIHGWKKDGLVPVDWPPQD